MLCCPSKCTLTSQSAESHKSVHAVMISAGFVHLLGSAVEELPVSTKHGFPWAPFLCATGYLITLVADQLATALSRSAS